MIRNSINITGITDEKDLPSDCLGQFIEYAETEYIFVPESNYPINNIYEITLDIEITNYRTINMKNNKVYVLDGNKKFKILCSPRDNNNSIVLKFNYPFNTFIDIDNNEIIKSAKVFVLDAYFQLINSRTIYSNITYLVSAEYADKSKTNIKTKATKENTIVSPEDFNDDIKPALSSTQKILVEDNVDFSYHNLVYNGDYNIKLNNEDAIIDTINPNLDEQSLTKEDKVSRIKYIDLFEEYL